MRITCPHRQVRQVRIGLVECVECGAPFARVYAKAGGGGPGLLPPRSRPHRAEQDAARYQANKRFAAWRRTARERMFNPEGKP